MRQRDVYFYNRLFFYIALIIYIILFTKFPTSYHSPPTFPHLDDTGFQKSQTGTQTDQHNYNGSILNNTNRKCYPVSVRTENVVGRWCLYRDNEAMLLLHLVNTSNSCFTRLAACGISSWLNVRRLFSHFFIRVITF